MKRSFEYCALRFLLQWERDERDLHKRIRDDEPGLDEIRKALRYFKVALNFKGLNKEVRAKAIRRALLKARTDPALSPQQKVIRLAQLFVNAKFQYNMSAASKLLWLSSQRPFLLYDKRAFDALKNKYNHKGEKTDYEAYYRSWRNAYKSSKGDVLKAVKKLPKARIFLPNNILSNDALLALVQKPWFRERVFDIYLWELGGE